MKRVLTIGLLCVFAFCPLSWGYQPQSKGYTTDCLDLIGTILTIPCGIVSTILGVDQSARHYSENYAKGCVPTKRTGKRSYSKKGSGRASGRPSSTVEGSGSPRFPAQPATRAGGRPDEDSMDRAPRAGSRTGITYGTVPGGSYYGPCVPPIYIPSPARGCFPRFFGR